MSDTHAKARPVAYIGSCTNCGAVTAGAWAGPMTGRDVQEWFRSMGESGRRADTSFDPNYVFQFGKCTCQKAEAPMTDTAKKADEIVRSVLTPVDWSPSAMFLIDGQWYESKWGCDMVDHLRDAIQAELERQPRWTPIEEANGWDGLVICRALNRSGAVLVWDAPRPIVVMRAIAQDMMNKYHRFYVYPAPPPFNPEDYKEVKP